MFIESVTGRPSLQFDVSFVSESPIMACDHCCTIEMSRHDQHFCPKQRLAFEILRASRCSQTKYLVIDSPRHQNQLSMLLASITASFLVSVEQRVAMFRCAAEPRGVPILEPFRRWLALEARDCTHFGKKKQ
jgi:hypothetical protein